MNKKLITIVAILSAFVFITTAQAEEKLRYNGSSTILKTVMYKASKAFKQDNGVSFDLKGKSTGFGIKKLLAGECDIAGGGRPLKDVEKGKGLVETKAFLDAYAFIVNKSNPINDITSTQITDILTGKLKQWDKLGGPAGKKIFIIAPPEKSAHYKNAKKIIGFNKLSKNSMMADMTPNVMKKVKTFPVSIGWLSSANVRGSKGVKILNVSHNGEKTAITQDNLSSGKYPYQQTMYFYTMGQPSGNTKDFIEFMQGKKGQAIISEAGFFMAE